ncbi:hypothetical protein IP69_19605 [Bosea sp. AAP35]|uniref:hypothetical protein n=1 Tax=Bosea sp. AAP35 TaxID=1523417 RepID=UPI0006B9D528|nr:hypothetical protein [Bosea sp. AAP35]KPF62964.1 hypothetical protein IP69_19605 [Bosea sp. AAP35]
MTDKDQDRSLAPTGAAGDTGSQNTNDAISDPLAAVTGTISDDPTLAELIAFRDSAPDLRQFAIEAKRCEDEAERLWFRLKEGNHVKMARISLKIVALSCTAMVAIWPVDIVEHADAKQALAKATAFHGDDTDYGQTPSLDAATAEQIRLHRAAFAVGELLVPPGPAAPAPADRGLAAWPLSRFDLVNAVRLEGGDASISGTQLMRWSAFVDDYPTLSDLVDLFARMMATADRLNALSDTTTEDPRPLRRAAEGARIIAYLTAARAAIWPAMLHSADSQAKLRLVALVTERACRGDALHQQAAIRHVISEANQIAKQFRLGATLELAPHWIPIV